VSISRLSTALLSPKSVSLTVPSYEFCLNSTLGLAGKSGEGGGRSEKEQSR
jgi:hypothetical protein